MDLKEAFRELDLKKKKLEFLIEMRKGFFMVNADVESTDKKNYNFENLTEKIDELTEEYDLLDERFQITLYLTKTLIDGDVKVTLGRVTKIIDYLNNEKKDFSLLLKNLQKEKFKHEITEKFQSQLSLKQLHTKIIEYEIEINKYSDLLEEGFNNTEIINDPINVTDFAIKSNI